MTAITPKTSFDTISELAQRCESQIPKNVKTDKLRAVFLYDANGKLSVEIAVKNSFRDYKLWFSEISVDIQALWGRFKNFFSKAPKPVPLTYAIARKEAESLFLNLIQAKPADTQYKTEKVYKGIESLSTIANFSDKVERAKILKNLNAIQLDERNAEDFAVQSIDTIWQSFTDLVKKKDLKDLLFAFAEYCPNKIQQLENDIDKNVIDQGLKNKTCSHVKEVIEDLFLEHIKTLSPMTPEQFQKSTDEWVHIIGGQWPNFTPETKEFCPQIFKEMLVVGQRLQKSSKTPKAWDKPLHVLNLVIEGLDVKIKEEAKDKNTYTGLGKALKSKIIKFIAPQLLP